MYKMCDRCRFNVPAKQSTCQVCGSHVFVTQQETARKPLGSAIDGVSKTMGGLQNMFSALSRELGETAAKAQRAASSMTRLLLVSGSDHDQVLSMHRSIGAGRSVQFVPVFSAHQGEPLETESIPESIPAIPAIPALFFEPFRARLISDERVFSPRFDLCTLRPLNVAARETETAEAVQELDAVAEEAAVDTLRKQIDDLKGWFQDYGKDGLLIKKELVAVPSTVSEKQDEEHESISESNEQSRQAA